MQHILCQYNWRAPCKEGICTDFVTKSTPLSLSLYLPLKFPISTYTVFIFQGSKSCIVWRWREREGGGGGGGGFPYFSACLKKNMDLFSHKKSRHGDEIHTVAFFAWSPSIMWHFFTGQTLIWSVIMSDHKLGNKFITFPVCRYMSKNLVIFVTATDVLVVRAYYAGRIYNSMGRSVESCI